MAFLQGIASGRLAVIVPVTAVLVACGAAAAGRATVSWSPPEQNTDGSPITRLAGYEIRYGTSPGALNEVIRLDDPTATTYVIRNLSRGTYYIRVTAYTASGDKSSPSALVSTTIP